MGVPNFDWTIDWFRVFIILIPLLIASITFLFLWFKNRTTEKKVKYLFLTFGILTSIIFVLLVVLIVLFEF